MSDRLDLTVDDHRVARLTVHGDLDLALEDRLTDAVRSALHHGPPARIVIDLVHVPFMDSSGLRGVLRSSRHAHEAGVPLTLAVVPGAVTMLLDTAGVTGWFRYE